MGFLTDLGNLAVGAIERDREITKEDLAIRAENLQANRDILIKQKDSKYKKELDEYYKEKTKFDDINKMNNMYADGTLGKTAYANFALSSTIPNWQTMSQDMKDDMVYNFDGKTIDYKLQGSVEEINKKAAVAQTLINNETSAAIKNAKGNSFLINQILGKKEIAEKDLLSAVESKLNAAEAVKMTEKGTENSGLDVKLEGDKKDLNWKKFKKKNPEWIKQYNNLDKEIKYGSATQNNNFLNFMKASQLVGTNTEANFKLTNNDTEIKGVTPAAQAILDTYKSIYDEVRKDFSAQVLAGNNVDITELRDFMTTEAINKKVQNIMTTRSYVQETGGAFEKGKRMDFVGVVPISVMNQTGEILVTGQAIADGGKGNYKPSNKEIVNLYKEFLDKEAPELEQQYSKNKTFNSLNFIQSNIQNEGEFKDKFLAFVSDKVGVSSPPDDPTTAENESILNSPKVKADEKMLEEMSSTGNSVIKLNKDGKVVPQTEGKFGTDKTRITLDPNNNGFKQGGNFITWEKIERLKQVDRLPNILKLRYETWKSKQPKKNDTSITSNSNSIDNDFIFSDMISNIEKDITKKKK
jgi:hypothetical protein